MLTDSVKVSQGHSGGSMVHKVSPGEQCEGVKQLEDGVAGLVDRHDHNPF